MRPARCVALVATPGAVLATGADTLLRSLAPYEIDRARSFKAPKARDSYIAAHVLVRRAAALATGARPQDLVLGQRCAQCGGRHGRPFIEGHPGIHVSLSHSDAAVAAVAGTSPNAIDVEGWDAWGADAVSPANVFSAPERRALAALSDEASVLAGVSARSLSALRLWVRKECLIKLGRLSLDTLASCDLASLGIEVPAEFATTRSTYAGLSFADWVQPRDRTSGAVASAEHVYLQFLG